MIENTGAPLKDTSMIDAPLATAPLIEFIDYSFRYRAQKHPTLHNINLKIYPGEKILIAGPSGSGKSTLGSCLNGLVPYNYPGEITGSLTVGGRTSGSVFELSEFVGTVLQDTDGQFVGLSSGEDIAFALENKGRPQAEMKARVLQAAKLVGADGYLAHPPLRLSGGQKQRVSMAGVLIENIPILLLDEPLAALDPSTGKRAIALIDDIAQQTGCTVIIIEHRLEDVLWKHIDRVVLLDEGRIIADCTPDEIVASDMLGKVGVRRPLYVLALERAGVGITVDKRPGRLDTLQLTDGEIERIRRWSETASAAGDIAARTEPNEPKTTVATETAAPSPTTPATPATPAINFVITAIIGTLLLMGYAQTRVKAGSLE